MGDPANPNPNPPAPPEPGPADGKWYDSLPDDLKGNDTLKGIDGVESLAKGYLTAQEQIKTLTPVIPDKPEGYELPAKFEGMPDELVSEAAASLAKNAHAAGITKEAAHKLMAGILADEKTALQAQTDKFKQEQEASMTELKKLYGDKTEERIKNGVERVNQIAVKAGIDQESFTKFLNETGIGDHPLMVRWAIALADLITPDAIEQSNASTAAKSTAQVLFPTMST